MPMFGPGNMRGKAAFLRYKKSKPKTKPAPRAPRASGAFAKKVLAVVGKAEETKYLAENIVFPSSPINASQATPASLQRLVPRMSQGTGDNQRIGDRVQPVKARSFIHYYINATNQAVDTTVNLLILHVKGASTAAAVAAIPNDLLLKVGDGTNTDPTVANQQAMLTLVNNYPVNTDQYTVLKKHQFRMAKGAGNTSGAPGGQESGQIANLPVSKRISFSWKPPVLKYNAAGDLLPANHYPVFITWATQNDASGNALQISYSVRTELFFKDA